jgi:hypothetical protein
MDTNSGDFPITHIQYDSPGMAIIDKDAENPESSDDRLEVTNTARRSRRGLTRPDPAYYFGFILTPNAEWTVFDRDDTTVTYELDDRDEYAKVSPLAIETVAVEPESRLRATLDRKTGRLLELEDHRVVEQELASDPEDPTAESQQSDDYGTRRFTYQVQTTFDRYGEATAPMPKGPIPSPSISDRAHELLSEFFIY